jgi:hypothetical protein
VSGTQDKSGLLYKKRFVRFVSPLNMVSGRAVSLLEYKSRV